WDGDGELSVEYGFGLRGSRSLSLVPRGGQTRWDVSSSWPSPSFSGAFLPDRPKISDSGFKASYMVDKLALGQPPVAADDLGPPSIEDGNGYVGMRNPAAGAEAISGQ